MSGIFGWSYPPGCSGPPDEEYDDRTVDESADQELMDKCEEIRVGHEMFVIAGINLGRPKFPIDIRRVRDGKMFKLTEAGAQRALNNP